MKVLTLNRLKEKEGGTFGVLSDEHYYFCLTLEPYWKDNQTDISCIPKGEYVCRRHSSEKYGEVWKVCDVPNRTDILIHKGNLANHTKGCILLGEEFGILCDLPAVLSSGRGYAEFTHVLRNENEFKLVIE